VALAKEQFAARSSGGGKASLSGRDAAVIKDLQGQLL